MKRFMAILMIVVLFSSSFTYKADASDIAIPIAVATGGITLGTGIAVVLSLTCVYMGVNLVVDNWDALSSGFIDFLMENDKEDVMDIVFEAAKNIETQQSYKFEVIEGGKGKEPFHLNDYVIPFVPHTTAINGSALSLEINDEVKELVASYLYQEHGWNLVGDQWMDRPTMFRFLEERFNMTMSDEDFGICNVIVYLEPTTNFSIFQSDYPFYIQYRSLTSKNSVYELYGKRYLETRYYEDGTRVVRNRTSGEYVVHGFINAFNPLESTGGKIIAGKPIVYNDHVVEVKGDYNDPSYRAFIGNGSMFEVPFESSFWNFDNIIGSSSDNIIMLDSEYLYDEMSKVNNLDKITKSDKLVDVVTKADTEAQKDYNTVISNPPTSKTNTSNEITPGGLRGILQDFAQWLFVPSPDAIGKFINNANETMQNNLGILTYPLTLVIRFLQEVNGLDNYVCILTIPPIVVRGHKIFNGVSMNLTEFFNSDSYVSYYNIYINITSFIMILAVVNMAKRKGDKILNGG